MNYESPDYHNSIDPSDELSELGLEQKGHESESPELLPAGSFERGFVWESHGEAVDEAEKAIRESLEALHWPASEIEDFIPAVREAVTNAVIHGNLGIRMNEGETTAEYDERRHTAELGENGAKKVNMEIYASERGVKVVITDEGNFIAEVRPVPGSESEDRSMMPNGRGLRIIVEGCDEIDSAPGQLTLVKYRAGMHDAFAEGASEGQEGQLAQG